MFQQFFEVFWPKAVEYVSEQGLSNTLNIKDFEHILETLQKNLKLLSAKAFDVETEINHGEGSGRKKRKREVEEWLEQVKSVEKEVDELGSQGKSKGFIMRFLDGGKAAQLNEQVEKLLQQSLNFGEPVLDVCGTRAETLLTNEMVGEVFNENMERILKLLENREVSKIGVYGMGGVGKTTLAKQIHNRLVQQSQGRVFWITVSQEFAITSLQDKIARCLGLDLSHEDDEAIRAARLNRFLSKMKNSVLILDDVWENIDMLKVGCIFSVECCRLIITTRSLEVCRRIGCKKLIQVVKLGKDESWKLFKETLENEIELDPQVEDIAKSMAEVCDGLPLGIIVVAGSMKGETAIHTWRNALAQLHDCVRGQDETGEVDEVFKVLKYSFDWLNINYQSRSDEFNTIQLCFMYCSLYPEDYKIRREVLVRKFISGGLVDERKRRRAQVEQGHSILYKLVNVCLLESCVYRTEECVKMHDLVRGMALKIGEGKYMVRAGDQSMKEISNKEEWTKDLEKVSFMYSKIERIEDGISPNCPNLSTLLLCWNQLNYIPNSFFSKMQGLCTLDLCGNSHIEILPDSINDLTSLKALLLEYCHKIEKVPYLGKLKALRELNLSHTAIKEAPQGLEELLNLRFLSMNAWRLKMIPRGLLLKLGHIQHLNVPIHTQIEELKGLKQLEKFGGGVKNVSDFNWFITTRGIHGICCYSIGVNSKNTFGLRFGMEGDLGGMENELVLCESNLKDEKVLGQGIANLTIWKCEGMSKCFVDDLSEQFNNPTSLKKLAISNCGGIEWIVRSDGQGSPITLEEISLLRLDDLKGVVMMGRGEIGPSPIAPAQALVFSFLKSLSICDCNKMRKVGLPVSGLPDLRLIYIRNCYEIEEIFIEDEGRADSILTTLTLSKLERLYLWELPRLRKVGLPVSSVPNLEEIHICKCGEIEEILEEDEGRAASIITTLTLPKLKVLSLQELPRLKSVSKTTINCNSISYIYIAKCPRLKNKMPLHFDLPLPHFLKEIKVEREWWESLDWDIHPNLPQLLQPFLRW